MNEIEFGRVEARFKLLAEEGRAAFIPFIVAADPTISSSLEILKGLPEAGADATRLISITVRRASFGFIQNVGESASTFKSATVPSGTAGVN